MQNTDRLKDFSTCKVNICQECFLFIVFSTNCCKTSLITHASKSDWGHSRAVLFLKWHRHKRWLDKQKNQQHLTAQKIFITDGKIESQIWTEEYHAESHHLNLIPNFIHDIMSAYITGLSHWGFLTYILICHTLKVKTLLNIHMQTCILDKMLMYSHFSSTLPKIRQWICSKTGL